MSMRFGLGCKCACCNLHVKASCQSSSPCLVSHTLPQAEAAAAAVAAAIADMSDELAALDAAAAQQRCWQQLGYALAEQLPRLRECVQAQVRMGA